jgi:hypothetical protein
MAYTVDAPVGKYKEGDVDLFPLNVSSYESEAIKNNPKAIETMRLAEAALTKQVIEEAESLT